MQRVPAPVTISSYRGILINKEASTRFISVNFNFQSRKIEKDAGHIKDKKLNK
jgi:hypothetical protein